MNWSGRTDLKAKDEELERLRDDALRQRGGAEELQRALDAKQVSSRPILRWARTPAKSKA